MAAGQPGRTAPWAKALGAVILALLATIVAAYIIGIAREAERKRSAFEATQGDARRFADTLSKNVAGQPIDRHDAQQALEDAVAKGHGLLFAVAPTEDGTRLVVQLERTYQRSMPLFGPADATADRCFTIDFGNSAQRSNITAHGPDDSCIEIARKAR
jgi:hypothetical protein